MPKGPELLTSLISISSLPGIAGKVKDTQVESTVAHPSMQSTRRHLPIFCKTRREHLFGVLAWLCPRRHRGLEEGAAETGSIKHWWATWLKMWVLPDLSYQRKWQMRKGCWRLKFWRYDLQQCFHLPILLADSGCRQCSCLSLSLNPPQHPHHPPSPFLS